MTRTVTAQADTHAVDARPLTRTFKDVEAVRGIDLSIRTGEVFGFLGPNGAGKTTTVRMLCTLLPPTSGSAHVAGVDVVGDPAEVRRRIGVALQEIGLDPASRLTVWDEVRRINAAGTTVFLTTQYLEEADQLCDRLAIIDQGTIVAEGTPHRLKAEMGHDVVTLTLDGTDAAATETAVRDLPGLERIVTEPDALALYLTDGAGSIAEIVRRLDHDDIRVGAISVSRPSLDDVFLQATGRRLEGAGEQEAEA